MEELETQPEGTPDSEPVEETAQTQPQTVSIEEWIASSEPAEEDAPEPAAIEDVQLLAVLEACVYVAEEPLMPAQIAAALNQDPERIRMLLQQLMAEFEKPEHGVSIKEVAGGYKMATKPEHHEAVRSFVKSLKAPLKLSLPALETLAVVAYKQPVTSPEIMDIRGVQGGGVLKTLLDRKLITEAGRKNVLGKPILYKTTKEFLIQFGLKDLSELPTLKEFEEIRRMSMAESETPETPQAFSEAAAKVESPVREDVAPEAPATDTETSTAAETAAGEAPATHAAARSDAELSQAEAPEVPTAYAETAENAQAEPLQAESPAPEPQPLAHARGSEIEPEAAEADAETAQAELLQAQSPAPGPEPLSRARGSETEPESAEADAETAQAEIEPLQLESPAPERQPLAHARGSETEPEAATADAKTAQAEPLQAESPAPVPQPLAHARGSEIEPGAPTADAEAVPPVETQET
jgi:segregation and condensation protein B